MTSDGSKGSSDEAGQERRIILHVYDDESRDFTSLTTYHGMRRIYSSTTWPSRIFWSLVVVTCLTLFMIHSGLILLFYNSRPTFTKTLDVPFVSKYVPSVTLCKSNYISDEKNSRLAYQILNDIPLNSNDLKNLRKMTSDNLLEDYLNSTRTLCQETIGGILLRNRVVVDPCKYFEEILTDIGYCLSFTYRDLSADASDTLEMQVNLKEGDNLSFQIHSHGTSSNMKSKRRYLRRSFRSILSVEISTEKLLHQDDWGSCHSEFKDLHYDGQLYQQNECEKNCVAMQYIERCSCVPFHLAKKGVKICTLHEMLLCKQVAIPTTICDCPLECERLLYKVADPSYVKLKTVNRSILQMEFPSSKVLTHYQMKRMKAVDLLSFVAGSMGLFLGMSCVTLLEIFIYLFKSVWGVFNDERHKTYWGNIIGDDDGGNRRQSYEQIVITTKSAKTEQDDLVSKLPVEENYAVIRDPNTRRTSIMRVGPPIGFEGRNRSNTAKSTDTVSPQTALTIRLMRPSVGRRKSVYNAFGNF